MGRIIKLQQSENGVVREAQVKLPNGRIIRRPINLLIPLEVGDNDAQNDITPKDTQSITTKMTNADQSSTTHRYNLRPRNKALH